ncbi:putative cysteine protease domain containing protein [Neospora caninum Liverpool]|uniref:Ubiquitin thioesterase OTU n=1 Tax=Neospora caninum (strain Liverpool) TaxID=572307 RepID=F0VJ82_NEOCL|nr:putative cysteine protease domain containing protein [Neospora caninum Liverpool]CBZ53793.1 putative cysteine protease domain containing protein [Neospora caninum Liverpool]|eukprot:XP_003883825.1 putative cysteine protease domain containing protein [Neospora caninum Liverpool]
MRSLVAILTFLFVQRCAALQPHLPSQSLRLLVGNALMPQMSHPCTSREYVADAVLRRLSRGSRDDLISDESVNNLLPGCLEVRDMPYRMHAREVPGDGACLFASVAACLWWSAFETHADLNDPAFLDMIGSLRQLAVDTLQDTNVSTLVLEGDEVLPRSSLVNLAAADYNTTPAAYCERMRLPNTWGGGPEIVALSHALRRVIVVYEVHDPSLRSGNSQGSSAHCMHPVCLGQLSSSDGTAQNAPNQTALKVIACLGFPQNVAEEPLHILFTSSAACSTGLRPHAGQTADHFLPLFPAVSRK